MNELTYPNELCRTEEGDKHRHALPGELKEDLNLLSDYEEAKMQFFEDLETVSARRCNSGSLCAGRASEI